MNANHGFWLSYIIQFWIPLGNRLLNELLIPAEWRAGRRVPNYPSVWPVASWTKVATTSETSLSHQAVKKCSACKQNNFKFHYCARYYWVIKLSIIKFSLKTGNRLTKASHPVSVRPIRMSNPRQSRARSGLDRARTAWWSELSSDWTTERSWRVACQNVALGNRASKFWRRQSDKTCRLSLLSTTSCSTSNERLFSTKSTTGESLQSKVYW